MTVFLGEGEVGGGAGITFVIQSCAFCFGLTLDSTFNIELGTDITFDVQRGVCFWPTFDQLFRHLISTSWVLKAVIREHHTVFRHLTSTSRLWKAVFTTHQT